MIRSAELSVFIALAVLVHLGFWFGFARPGSESAGSGGEATVSLMAASRDMAEMVEAWSQPVEVAQSLATPQTPAPPEAAPTVQAYVSEPKTQQAPPDALASPSIDNVATVVLPSPVADLPEVEPPTAPQEIATPQTAFEQPAEVAAFEAPQPRQMNVPNPASQLPEIVQSSERPPLLDAAPRASLRPVARPDQKQAAPKPTPAQPVAQSPSPQPQTEQQSTGALPQTAAGQRSGQNAGNADTQRAATLSPATRQSLLAQWGASIRNSVERQKHYPRSTRANGTTLIRLTVSRSGGLLSASVARSSGSPALDQAALQAVQRARYRPAPRKLDVPQFSFNLPLSFKP
ncbi:MAG: TonB family protein [Pseudomonadota bacterium]